MVFLGDTMSSISILSNTFDLIFQVIFHSFLPRSANAAFPSEFGLRSFGILPTCVQEPTLLTPASAWVVGLSHPRHSQ